MREDVVMATRKKQPHFQPIRGSRNQKENQKKINTFELKKRSPSSNNLIQSSVFTNDKESNLLDSSCITRELKLNSNEKSKTRQVQKRC